MGAVPVQEPKWFLSGNLVMSPTSTSSRAAPEGADPVQVHQGDPRGGDQVGQLLVRGLLALVDPFEVGDQLGGDATASLAGGITWADRCQERPGLGCGQVLLHSAGNQLEQQVVHLRHLAGALLAQRPPTVDQDPQHRQLLVIDDGSQSAHPGADERHGVRIGGVGLAALPGGEHPRPRGQLRRDVDDLFAIGQEPVRHVPPDARTSLDRPDAVRPRPCTYRRIAA